MPHSVILFLLFLKASLLSTGGFGPLPLLQQDLVQSRHWATAGTIAGALAVGRISPGPNGLFVISLGYFIDGVPGALAATMACLLPPFLVLVWAGFYRRYAHLRIVYAVTRGIRVAVVGLIVAVGLSLAQAEVHDPFGLAVAVLAGLIVAFTRFDAMLILAAAALAGILVAHL
jgi:chromate transporter